MFVSFPGSTLARFPQICRLGLIQAERHGRLRAVVVASPHIRLVYRQKHPRLVETSTEHAKDSSLGSLTFGMDQPQHHHQGSPQTSLPSLNQPESDGDDDQYLSGEDDSPGGNNLNANGDNPRKRQRRPVSVS